MILDYPLQDLHVTAYPQPVPWQPQQGQVMGGYSQQPQKLGVYSQQAQRLGGNPQQLGAHSPQGLQGPGGYHQYPQQPQGPGGLYPLRSSAWGLLRVWAAPD